VVLHDYALYKSTFTLLYFTLAYGVRLDTLVFRFVIVIICLSVQQFSII